MLLKKFGKKLTNFSLCYSKAKPEQNSTSSLSKLSMIVAGINTKQEESNGDSPKV